MVYQNLINSNRILITSTGILVRSNFIRHLVNPTKFSFFSVEVDRLSRYSVLCFSQEMKSHLSNFATFIFPEHSMSTMICAGLSRGTHSSPTPSETKSRGCIPENDPIDTRPTLSLHRTVPRSSATLTSSCSQSRPNRTMSASDTYVRFFHEEWLSESDFSRPYLAARPCDNGCGTAHYILRFRMLNQHTSSGGCTERFHYAPRHHPVFVLSS